MFGFRCAGLLSAAALLAAGASLVSMPATAQNRSTLVIGSFGGSVDASLRNAVEGFEDEFNVTLQWVPGPSQEQVAKAIAAKAAPDYDVILLDNTAHAVGEPHDIFEQVDESIVTNYEDLYEAVRMPNKNGVAIGVNYSGIFYRHEEFERRGWAPPESWEDLFRPEFCGHVALFHPNVSYGLHTLIMLSGGDMDNIQQGIDRIASLKGCVPVLEPSAPKLEEALLRGEYLVGVGALSRTSILITQGHPISFVLPKEGAPLALVTASAIKNAPNSELAQQFLNAVIGPEAQFIKTEEGRTGATNVKVEITDEWRAMGMPDEEAINRLIRTDDAVLADNRRDWIQRLERAWAAAP